MRTRTLARAVAAASVPVAIASCAQIIGLDQYHDGICVPGSTKSDDCVYPGPPDTEGVGICKAGVRTCAEDGRSWSDCSKPTLPEKEENCESPEDDDCNGEVNEASAGCCTPGDKISCYTGLEGTEGIGICKAGTLLCGTSGKIEGACSGEVHPKQETCADPADENCDGHDCAIWAEVFGDSAAQAILDVAVHSDGTIVGSGGLYGSIMVNGTTLSESGGGDILIVKTNATGEVDWAQAFGDAGSQHAAAVAVDSMGAIIFSGCTETAFDLGGHALPSGVFLAKLSKDGKTVAWARSLGTDGCSNGPKGFNMPGVVTKIIATPSNDVAIVGGFQGHIDLGAGSVAAMGGVDGFVAYVRGSDGSIAWANVFGDAADQQANDVAYSPLGELLVVGSFQGSFSFGWTSTNVSSMGGGEAFVLEIGGDGQHASARTFGGVGEQSAHAIAIMDGAGAYAIGGTFSQTIDFGGGPVSDPTGTGTAYVAAFDASGKQKWVNVFGRDQFMGGVNDLGRDNEGNLLVSGSYDGAIDFGVGQIGSAGAFPFLSVFVAKLAPSGDALWEKSFGTAMTYTLGRTRLAPTGETVMAGTVSAPIDFGTGTLTPAGTDAFIAKFGL